MVALLGGRKLKKEAGSLKRRGIYLTSFLQGWVVNQRVLTRGI